MGKQTIADKKSGIVDLTLRRFRKRVLIFHSYVTGGDGTNISPPGNEAINLSHAPD